MTPPIAPFKGPGSTPPDRSPPMFNVPPVTLCLLVVLLAVFLVLRFAGPDLVETVLWWLSLIPMRIAAAVDGPFGVETALAAATLVTHALLHLDLLHFIANAGFLLAFGSAVERALGTGGYLRLILASAAGGALAQLLADWGQQVVMYGASGVVSGCMGGVVRLMLSPGALPQRRRTALNLVGVFFVVNLLFALVGGRLMGVDADVAWEAHIGGFIAGFLVARRGAVRSF